MREDSMAIVRRLSRRLVCIAVSLGAIMAARAAHAQDNIAEGAGPLAQPVSAKSLERIGAALKLDGDQKALVRTLYSGYRVALKQASDQGDKELKSIFEKAQEGDAGPGLGGKERVRIIKAFVEQAKKLEHSFMDDVKAILTPDQVARFDRAEHARRRETGYRFSFVSGEGVDVLQILSDLKIDRDASPELREAADQYEVEADRLMIAKAKMLDEVFEQMEKIEGGEPDPKLIEKMLTDFFGTGTKLRDMNRAHARKIAPLVPADKQVAFEREIKELSFPRVYAESPAIKTIKAAQDIPGLSAGQKSELASVLESYSREAEGANSRWAAAIEDKQSKIPGHFMEMMMAGEEGEKADDPLKQARDARKALDDRIVARVQQVLKADQREKLPKFEDEGGHKPEWEPDFDERGTWDDWKKEDEAPQPPKDH